MSITKKVQITCDIPWCHTSADFDHQYGPAARTELAQQGWAYIQHSRKDFCPEHATLGSGVPPNSQVVPETET